VKIRHVGVVISTAAAGAEQVHKVKHHPALPYNEMADFTAALRNQEGVAARALEFLILTAARTGEVISAPGTKLILTASFGSWRRLG